MSGKYDEEHAELIKRMTFHVQYALDKLVDRLGEEWYKVPHFATFQEFDDYEDMKQFAEWSTGKQVVVEKGHIVKLIDYDIYEV